MKIAMIGHKRIPSREGGIEIVVEELSTRLIVLGYTVHAYNRMGHHVSGKGFAGSHTGNNCKMFKGIRILTIPTFQNGKLNALVYSFFATIRALFGKYDIIHYHAEGPCVMLQIPHLFGIQTIATIHGLDWQRAKWGGFAARYLKYGEKTAAKYADKIIVLSESVRQYFLDTYGKKVEKKVQFIPNGIVKPKAVNDTVISEKFGLNKDDYILFLGRIVPEKGLHYLIDAFREVDTPKKLVIAGGSSHTDDYMSEMIEKAKSDKRVMFTDFVQGEELEALYSNAYVYVFPSDLEGMPISLLEAMSYGNCCLVSDIAENIEVVEDKAIWFKKGDINDLTAKLEFLIKNANSVETYRKNASEYICEKYNWDDIVDKTVKLYIGR